MKDFEPMLASPAPKAIKFPVLASPKLDGIRCLILSGVVVGRSLKPIPNKHVQQQLGNRPMLEGLDGELVVGAPAGEGVFQRTSSGVMSIEGAPDFTFHVFDTQLTEGVFTRRLQQAFHQTEYFPRLCRPVEHVLLASPEELEEYERRQVEAGYEGVMLRDPHGPYKHGRSTPKEGWLLKVKRFQDSEAVILGFTELMHNANEATTNALGKKERSSRKAGLVGKGCLGAMTVRDAKTGIEFDLGTGFTQADREIYWAVQQDLLGRVIKYKFQPVGVKDKPRFPVFLGFRHEVDL